MRKYASPCFANPLLDQLIDVNDAPVQPPREAARNGCFA
jgi:hypothetical protein